MTPHPIGWPLPWCWPDKVKFRGGGRDEAAGGATNAEERAGISISPSCQDCGQATHGPSLQATHPRQEAGKQASYKHMRKHLPLKRCFLSRSDSQDGPAGEGGA